MVTKGGLYPAEEYVDEYVKDESEECRRCKGGCGYIPMSGEYACKGFRPMTNSERIRTMSDEELAEFMALNTDCYYCRAKDNDRCASLATTPCGDIWLDWLKQEADDDKSGQDQRDDG